MFIGPTSQAPRVDEARDDRLYELAIAFQQLGRKARPATKRRSQGWSTACCGTWLTDRTGNTHRAEFSIDKLYSPDTGDRTTRFARIPRVRNAAAAPGLSAVQVLLLRALVARFWRDPYRGELIPWGTARTTAGCCRISWRPTSAMSRPISIARGYAFDPAWFEPFVEFRFPRFGTATYAGVTLEIAAGRSNHGMCWGEEGGAGRHGSLTSTRRWNGCRSRSWA
jgi:uncharacterized protein (DUF2126 family)